MNARLTMLATIVAFALRSWAAHAQWLSYPTPGVPRLPDGRPNLSAPAPLAADGKPDLSGIWAAECAIYDGSPCFPQSLFFDLARDLKPGVGVSNPGSAPKAGITSMIPTAIACRLAYRVSILLVVRSRSCRLRR